jgi:lysozyme
MKLHEGIKLMPYMDTKGKLTIGVGRNLHDRGITKDEADMLLENDLRSACIDVELYFPWVGRLSRDRQMVYVNMCFNMGISKLRDFKKMHMATASGDFEAAAKEMLDSSWSRQVGNRSFQLAEMMRHG